MRMSLRLMRVPVLIESNRKGTEKMSKSTSIYCALLLVLPMRLHGASLTPIPDTGFSFQAISGKPMPVWNGGAFLAVDAFSSSNPVINVLNMHGAQIGSVSITIPESKLTAVRCVARGDDGTIVAGGWTSSVDGRTASILAVVSPDGAVSISRTDPFQANQLTFAQDGSIWAQGFIGRNPERIVDADPAHGIIRHFDRAGKMTGSFLPEAKLNNRLREMRGYLAVAAGRVGWISWVESAYGGIVAGGYVEIATDGSLRELPLPVMVDIRGFTITNTGIPMADVVTERPNSGHPQRSGMMSLNRETATWEAVDMPGSTSMTGKTLIGGSGGTLAILDVGAKTVSFLAAN